jgi:hypothetical protein
VPERARQCVVRESREVQFGGRPGFSGRGVWWPDRRGFDACRVVRPPERCKHALRVLGPERDRCPTAWRLVLSETKAGQRRYADTDHGERYGRWLAHYGVGDASAPKVSERPLRDVLHPLRSVRPVHVVNDVSRAMSADVAGWRWERVAAMMGTLEREAQARGNAEI